MIVVLRALRSPFKSHSVKRVKRDESLNTQRLYIYNHTHAQHI